MFATNPRIRAESRAVSENCRSIDVLCSEPAQANQNRDWLSLLRRLEFEQRKHEMNHQCEQRRPQNCSSDSLTDSRARSLERRTAAPRNCRDANRTAQQLRHQPSRALVEERYRMQQFFVEMRIPECHSLVRMSRQKCHTAGHARNGITEERQ